MVVPVTREFMADLEDKIVHYPTVSQADIKPLQETYQGPQLGAVHYPRTQLEADSIGQLTAEAIVKDSEETAKKVELMGEELIKAAKASHEEIKQLAQQIREKGKRASERAKAMSAITTKVRRTAEEMARQIDANVSQT